MHKEIRNTLAWIIFATFVTLTAIWQAQVAAARDLAERQRSLPPPAKTKSAIRPAPVWAGDPVEDYIARCEKGLTDQEIGWMVEDFRNAGLDIFGFTDETPDAVLIDYRAAQQRWYHRALVDGLRLSPTQSAEAATQLSELFQKEVTGFRRDRAGKNSGQFPEFPAARFEIILSHLWLFGGYGEDADSEIRYLPWDLCALTARQEEITWKAEMTRPDPSDKSSIPPPGSLRERFQSRIPLEPAETLPEDFVLTGAVFPFLNSQEFTTPDDSADEIRGGGLVNLRRLHPAQLRMLLLFYPETAGQIQNALDAANR